MGEAVVGRYWCHICSQTVNPVMELEMKCPFCDSGFVEEMDDGQQDTEDLGSDRALSLWAIGMMGGRSRRAEEADDYDEEDPDIRSILRRRRRSSAMLQLIQSIRDDLRSMTDRDREGVILINDFNQQDADQTQSSTASLRDYFIGSPGLEMLLQHPNRYGTPPAEKEAVDAMPTVKIGENVSCTVCLEDFDIGAEAKEMPCKHKFHGGCILPWLELHSSCPVCRFRLPVDESSKEGSNRSGDVTNEEGVGGDSVLGGNGGLSTPLSAGENSSSAPPSTSGANFNADEN